MGKSVLWIFMGKDILWSYQVPKQIIYGLGTNS